MNVKLLTAGLISAALLTPAASFAADNKPMTDSKPAVFVKDSVITTKIKSKLAAEKLSSLAKVSVDTDANGMVVLSGTVKDKATQDKAESIARATEGVTSVQNKITVKADS